MASQNMKNIKLSPLGWIVIALILIFFWEPLLHLALLIGAGWILWKFRIPIINTFNRILKQLTK